MFTIIRMLSISWLFIHLSFPVNAAKLSEEQCAFFHGVWFGQVSGYYKGEMRMKVKANCSYKISGQFATPGRFSYNDSRKKIEYRNDLGSRGIVEVSGGSIKMWNAYTGNNYEIIWQKAE